MFRLIIVLLVLALSSPAFGAGIVNKSIGGLIDVLEAGAVGEVLEGLGAGNAPAFDSKTWIDVTDYGAVGDNDYSKGAANVTAINAAIAAAGTPSGTNYTPTIYFPAGIYRVTPGGLNPFVTGVYGPEAAIGASTTANERLVQTAYSHFSNNHTFVLRALLGYDALEVFTTSFTSAPWGPIANTYGYGLSLIGGSATQVHSHRAFYRINWIAGFYCGLALDGEIHQTFQDGRHIAGNEFQIGTIINNEIGILLRAGADYQCESNKLYIRYMTMNEINVYAAAAAVGAETGTVVSNLVDVNVMELHVVNDGIFVAPAERNDIGFYLDGGALSKVYQNEFLVRGSFTQPHNTGNAVACYNGAHDNIFQLCDIDWSTVVMTSAAQIFNTMAHFFGSPDNLTALGRSRITDTAAPTQSRWRAGDVCWNTNPVTGTDYWVCTVSGAPGTWVAKPGGGMVSDTAYAASWNGVTTIAPSKNAVYDSMATRGVNTNITSITGLTVDLSIAQGGTSASTAAAALSALGVGTEDSPTFSGMEVDPASGAGLIIADGAAAGDLGAFYCQSANTNRAYLAGKSGGTYLGFNTNLYFETTPGGADQMVLSAAGNLHVTGNITATGTCCDYVLEPGYKLPTFEEVRSSITTTGKLPGLTFPEGISTIDLMVKVEEQALYILQLHDRITRLEAR